MTALPATGALARPMRARVAVFESPRRALQILLGLVWLLDAALQYQPYMFGSGLGQDIVQPSGDGSPVWVSGPVHWTATLIGGAPALWNTVFATVQLAIAVGLLYRPTVRLALAGSVVWALGLWWLAEGLGGVLAGPVLPEDGLPGAAVLYALLAVFLWPNLRSRGPSVAERGLLGRVGAVAVWVALWAAFAVESLRPANRAPQALHDLVAGNEAGEPAWVKAVERWGAAGLDHHGTEVSIVTAVLFAAIALFGAGPFSAFRRPALLVAAVLGAAIWVFGETFGTIATGQATDPDSGLLLVLLAVAFWPTASRATASRTTLERG